MDSRPSAGLTVGAYLLGIFLNTYLFGVVTFQIMRYKSTPFKDPIWIKATVAVLFLVDVVHSAVEIYGAFDIAVNPYEDPQVLTWVVPFTDIAISVTALLTLGFLGQRVFMLTHSRAFVGVLGVLSVVSFICGIYTAVQTARIRDVVLLVKSVGPFAIVWLSSMTVVDLLITITLSMRLLGSRTGFTRTDHVLVRLVRGAVQTGFVVSLFALGCLFSFLFAANNTLLYMFFAFPLGRIYTVTLIDTLNSRTSLSAHLAQNNGVHDVDSELATISVFRREAFHPDGDAPQAAIMVTKEVVTDRQDPDAKVSNVNWYAQSAESRDSP